MTIKQVFAFIVITAAAVCSPGCATAKQVAAVAVVESDRSADELAGKWREAVHDRVEHCRASLPPDASKNAKVVCLGDYAPAETAKLIASIKVLVATQLAVKAAVECEAFDACTSDTNWRELATAVIAAWEDVQPFAQTLKDR